MIPPLGWGWQMIWQKVGPVYAGKPGYCKYAICLWLEKGQSKTRIKIWDIYIKGKGNHLPISDNGHKWRKSADNIAFWLDAFSSSEAIVVDFFAGGGTIPAVCKMLGRRWLAFEIEPQVAESARQRVRETQPPLLVPESAAVQAVMWTPPG